MRLTLTALACVVLLAGCGGASDEEGVRQAVDDYFEAIKEKDGDKFCDSVVSPELLKMPQDERAKEIEACKDDFSSDEFDNAPETTGAEVADIVVKGDQATALLTFTESGKKETSKLRFVKVDGDWKLRFDSR